MVTVALGMMVEGAAASVGLEAMGAEAEAGANVEDLLVGRLGAAVTVAVAMAEAEEALAVQKAAVQSHAWRCPTPPSLTSARQRV